ncbi:NAD(P)-binding domain-containing protein [Actinoplanes sp. NPDC024001]|uniref:NAD(P)-dependent oxidoreductase n=1 Tax=Actinoplanes sp. NPDC024001 TaxID=3154598 RepID=UPI0033E1AEBD
MTTNATPVTLLGLGAMGSALATALLKAGHPVTLWNRTPGKADHLAGPGVTVAGTPDDAVRANDLIIVCLLDHASVHQTLDPLARELAGRTVINLTTTSPAQARELAAWAADAQITYLDGGIMAVPGMIGQPGASILYSGDAGAFEQHRALLEQWGASRYLGADAGLASLYDLALLAGMYVMFAGFMHGVAMVAPAGVPARDFAAMASPWLAAMAGELDGFATVIDGGDYTVAGQQSLDFSDLGDIVAASAEQGISTEVVDMVQRLIRRQIDAGHGSEGFARIVESIRAA